MNLSKINGKESQAAVEKRKQPRKETLLDYEYIPQQKLYMPGENGKIYPMLKDKNCQLRMFSPAKLYFRYVVGEIKFFPNKR